MEMQNPFETLLRKLSNIEQKLEKLDKKTLEQPEPVYTVKEVAKLLHLSEQTIRKKIDIGQIEADTNTKPFLIPHGAIYNENNRLRKFRYKRAQ